VSNGEAAEVKQIYVSPHSDDAALSCGGQIIAGSPDDALVLNVFASEGDAQSALFDSVNAERTREDEVAWDSVGVALEQGRLPEALLRRKFPFQIVGGGPDPEVIQSVHELLYGYVRSEPGATFHLPAGFGSHVDHLACREAGLRLLNEGRLDRIMLYEDAPYSWLSFIRRQHYRALRRRIDLDRESRVAALRREGVNLSTYLRDRSVPFPRGKKLFPLVHASLLARNSLPGRPPAKPYRGTVRTIALSDAQMAKKQELIFQYRSQLPMLFGKEPEKVLDRLRSSFSKEVVIEVTRKR
jgi:LmbE family N-acetylglucosaminyl deacetylase